MATKTKGPPEQPFAPDAGTELHFGPRKAQGGWYQVVVLALVLRDVGQGDLTVHGFVQSGARGVGKAQPVGEVGLGIGVDEQDPLPPPGQSGSQRARGGGLAFSPLELGNADGDHVKWELSIQSTESMPSTEDPYCSLDAKYD